MPQAIIIRIQRNRALPHCAVRSLTRVVETLFSSRWSKNRGARTEERTIERRKSDRWTEAGRRRLWHANLTTSRKRIGRERKKLLRYSRQALNRSATWNFLNSENELWFRRVTRGWGGGRSYGEWRMGERNGPRKTEKPARKEEK